MISLSRLRELAQAEIYKTVCVKVDRIRDVRLEELEHIVTGKQIGRAHV